ncbi:dual specificity protein phosphatase [Achlya hypogyna]|uniref:protein-tyrosine-phosphatase n=1 Tax=Achlya hypogyna TaxID=1202772 RepID=A0A1V9YKJ3_ACHHY|nr:dual specificity protein phosphatase [Achlya hypogyna]
MPLGDADTREIFGQLAMDLMDAVEFVPGTVYYTTLRDGAAPRSTPTRLFFSIDRQLLYANFYLDFGPLNLGQTFQFCEILNHELTKAKTTGREIVFFSSPDGKRRANAVCLLGCWGILFNGMSATDAFAPFAGMALPTFHDATPTVCLFKLTVLDCLKGLEKAVKCGYISPDTFSIEEYQHYEQVENGDLNWLSPKFIAFAGPYNEYKQTVEGYISLTPEHYIPYFKKHNVTLVVRLNEKLYDENRFIDAGIDHLELFYPDGGNPPEAILLQFIQACEATTGAVAVHCKAGLGRTGTCIGAYLMKHDRFTAKECIGWLRLCRAGSVIGPQQHYMETIEKKMWLAKRHIDDDSHVVMVSPCKTKQRTGTNIFTAPTTTLPGAALSKVNRSAMALSLSTTAFLMSEPSPKTQGDNLIELKHGRLKSPGKP